MKQEETYETRKDIKTLQEMELVSRQYTSASQLHTKICSGMILINGHIVFWSSHKTCELSVESYDGIFAVTAGLQL